MEKKLNDLVNKEIQSLACNVSVSDSLLLKNSKRVLAHVYEAPVELQIKNGFERIEGSKFEVFKTEDDKINFRFKEADGNVILSGSGYDNLSDCLDCIEVTKESFAQVVYSTELTAIREKPFFIPKKAVPKYNSSTEEQAQLQKRSKDFGFFIDRNRNNRPSFISGRISDKKITSTSQAIHALNNLHYTIGFENAEQEFPENAVEIRRHNGTIFYRMKQYHKGIPVIGNTLILSTDSDGNSQTLSGHYTPITCDDDVIITEAQAMATSQRRHGSVLNSGGLAYYTDYNERTYLCWCINSEKYTSYISTVNGDVIYEAPNIISVDINTNKHIRTLLNETADISILNADGGSPYSLYDGKRRIEIYDDHDDETKANIIKVNSLSTEDNAVLFNDHAVTAYAYMKQVYDYYLNVLGRKGADNAGKKIRILLNDHEFHNQVNAQFYASTEYCTRIGLSARGGIERCLDIIGHEFTHAVNQSIWDPEYCNESGALNEAYADIMGEFIQDEELDTHGENKTIGNPRRFNNSYTMDDYEYEKPTEDNDYGGVHTYAKIITHAAHLMQQNWPDEDKRYELSAIFYHSMESLDNKSSFVDCYYALLFAIATIKPKNMRKKLAALADAFIETKIMCQRGNGTREVTGTIKDRYTDEPIPAVVINASYPNDYESVASTISNSRGEFILKLKDGDKYKLRCFISDGIAAPIDTQTISSDNCGPFDFKYENKWGFPKPKFFISGKVCEPGTGRALLGATIKILKGKHTMSQVMTMKPDVVLKTDHNGYFFSAALPQGKYDVWAYALDSKNYCLSQIVNIENSTDPFISFYPIRQKLFYVTGLCIRSSSSQTEAKQTKRNYTLIDVDLNQNTSGDYIYISYEVDNHNIPITNLLVFESSSEQTWSTLEITHNRVKAVYTRLKINLNRNARGKYLYLCYTTDKRFAPLTQLDVIVKGRNVVREPFWSGVRVVRNSLTSVDEYADINAGTGGKSIYILQTKREIL